MRAGAGAVADVGPDRRRQRRQLGDDDLLLDRMGRQPGQPGEVAPVGRRPVAREQPRELVDGVLPQPHEGGVRRHLRAGVRRLDELGDQLLGAVLGECVDAQQALRVEHQPAEHLGGVQPTPDPVVDPPRALEEPAEPVQLVAGDLVVRREAGLGEVVVDAEAELGQSDLLRGAGRLGVRQQPGGGVEGEQAGQQPEPRVGRLTIELDGVEDAAPWAEPGERPPSLVAGDREHGVGGGLQGGDHVPNRGGRTRSRPGRRRLVDQPLDEAGLLGGVQRRPVALPAQRRDQGAHGVRVLGGGEVHGAAVADQAQLPVARIGEHPGQFLSVPPRVVELVAHGQHLVPGVRHPSQRLPQRGQLLSAYGDAQRLAEDLGRGVGQAQSHRRAPLPARAQGLVVPQGRRLLAGRAPRDVGQGEAGRVQPGELPVGGGLDHAQVGPPVGPRDPIGQVARGAPDPRRLVVAPGAPHQLVEVLEQEATQHLQPAAPPAGRLPVVRLDLLDEGERALRGQRPQQPAQRVGDRGRPAGVVGRVGVLVVRIERRGVGIDEHHDPAHRAAGRTSVDGVEGLPRRGVGEHPAVHGEAGPVAADPHRRR